MSGEMCWKHTKTSFQSLLQLCVMLSTSFLHTNYLRASQQQPCFNVYGLWHWKREKKHNRDILTTAETRQWSSETGFPWLVAGFASEESCSSLPGLQRIWWNLQYSESAKDFEILYPLKVQSLPTKCSANLVLADLDSGVGCSLYRSRGLQFIADNLAQE